MGTARELPPRVVRQRAHRSSYASPIRTPTPGGSPPSAGRQRLNRHRCAADPHRRRSIARIRALSLAVGRVLWLPQSGVGDLGVTVSCRHYLSEISHRCRPYIADLGGSPIVGGPATGDLAGPDTGNDWELPRCPAGATTTSSPRTSWRTSPCMWTQHNYSDVCYDQGRNTKAPSAGRYRLGAPEFVRTQMRASVTRTLLQQGGWKGFPTGSSADPRLYPTEVGPPER
jgi:hypothetical protein